MDRYRVELLPNGLYRVFDYQCKWSLVYSFHPELACCNVRWEHGGVDSMAARVAVVKFISARK
jgi:hypothetical protein